MAALSGITGITIELTINGTPYPAINADETTTTAVLPKIKAGDKISGKATINLSNGDPRVAYLDETEAALHGVLKFKVPYTYTANNLAGQPVASGTYYARDGINLSTATTSDIAGWQCAEDGSVHYGSYVTGVRGDITLNAVSASGVPVLSATASPENLYATATSGDTTTITITGVTGSPQVSSISNELEQQGAIVPDNASNPTSYTLTVKIKGDPTSTMGDPIWFNDDTTANVTITDDSGAIKSVPLTLKNKYTFTVADASNSPYPQGDKDQGTSYSFDDLKGIIPSSAIPAGREVVAFEEGTRIFKESDFPITLGSSTFTQRLVRLKAVLDFTCSRSDGGYGTTASPLNSQTGTSTNPYLLNYYGNDTNKRNQIELEISDHKCADSALTIEPAPAQTAIFNATFDITPTGNKFLIKINPALAENSVYTSDTIKLTITDPTTGAKKDIHVQLMKNRIGNKPAPNAVGDIVFNDGSAMSYTDFNGLSTAVQNEKKAAAIALIFYKGSSGDALGARTLGVGLKHDRNGLKWCTTSADARDKNIDTIQCIPSGSPGAYNFSGDKDGSNNLAQIDAFDGVDDTGTEANYPAFYFAKKYNEQKLGSESSSRIPAGSEFEDGWYLPSIAELFQIYACREDSTNGFNIDTASQALGGDSFRTSSYWSSSQSASYDYSAYGHNFANSFYYDYSKDGDNSVCAVRAF